MIPANLPQNALIIVTDVLGAVRVDILNNDNVTVHKDFSAPLLQAASQLRDDVAASLKSFQMEIIKKIY